MIDWPFRACKPMVKLIFACFDVQTRMLRQGGRTGTKSETKKEKSGRSSNETKKVVTHGTPNDVSGEFLVRQLEDLKRFFDGRSGNPRWNYCENSDNMWMKSIKV